MIRTLKKDFNWPLVAALAFNLLLWVVAIKFFAGAGT